MMKKIISFILTLSFVLTLFASCTGNKKSDDGNTPPTDNSYKINLDGYKIIRSYSAGSDAQADFADFRDLLTEKTGIEKFIFAYDLDLEDDGGCEILLGKTNRKESTDAYDLLASKTKKEAFIIKVTEKRIVILGLSDDDTRIGLMYFVKNFVKTITKADKTISLPKEEYTYMAQTGELLKLVNDGNTAVLIEGLTTIIKPEDPLDTTDYTYGKVIRLEHQADESKNGILIATNENTECRPWDIYHSYDNGKTWKTSDPVIDTINSYLNPGYQSYLFELPVDIGEFKKGTVLFAGCSYSGNKIVLPLFASTNQGKSWTGLHNIAEGGGFNKGGWTSDGVWEPCLVYDDKTQKLYCFYSDEQLNGEGEDHVGGHNQRIVYKCTSDLKTWSDEVDVITLGAGRPGMAMVTKMGNGQWALVYENIGSGIGGTPIFIKFTDDITKWNPTDQGKLVESDMGGHCGSSPAITWTPAGGDCGTLVITANGQVGGNPTAKCDIFLSFDYGKTFITVPNPIPITISDNVRCSYSPGLFTDSDGVVYYVNNPVLMTGATCGKLMFVKFRFY